MAVSYTADQQKVIDTRNKNILVSAAAGSGKTAVLVERIIQRVTDREHPIDIDRLLVVTFTSAAAAEMKERISNAIQAKLAENPSDLHLQRQAVLVHQAQITTMHSFCLYLIKNHFEDIGLEPDFTVADEGTVKLLAAECKENLLEEAFAKGEEDFLFTVEFICHNGRESVLEDYLDHYEGIVIAVSHDRYFLDRTMKRLFAFEEGGKLRQHEGGYTDYALRMAAEKEVEEQVAQQASKAATKAGGSNGTVRSRGPQKLKFTYKEQKDYETIEGDMAALEDKIADLEKEIARASSDFIKLNKLLAEKEEAEAALEEKMERWMYLEELAAKIAEQ